jgi:hypothetical protein
LAIKYPLIPFNHSLAFPVFPAFLPCPDLPSFALSPVAFNIFMLGKALVLVKNLCIEFGKSPSLSLWPLWNWLN